MTESWSSQFFVRDWQDRSSVIASAKVSSAFDARTHMDTFHEYWRSAHIWAGSLGLLAFWVPIFTVKGSRVHRAAGQLFLICVWIVAVTAIVSALWALVSPETFIGPSSERSDPEQYAALVRSARFFLAMLGTLALSALEFAVVGRHALLAQSGRRPLRFKPVMFLVGMAASSSLLFGLWGIYLLTQQWFEMGAIACVVGGLTLSSQRTEWRYLFATDHAPFAWWYKHMEGMIGAGIAFHTAFAVFGGQRLMGDMLSGVWRVVPWVIPAVVGTIGLAAWKRHYERRCEGSSEGRKADGSPADWA